jgi:hypothetical protein
MMIITKQKKEKDIQRRILGILVLFVLRCHFPKQEVPDFLHSNPLQGTREEQERKRRAERRRFKRVSLISSRDHRVVVLEYDEVVGKTKEARELVV